MKLVLTIFAILVAAIGIFGQTLPNGVRVMSSEERVELIRKIEANEFNKSAKNGGSAMPRFTFTFNGDYRTGAIVYGRNTDSITAETIIIGVKRYPGQAAQYLAAFYIIATPVDQGVLWYPLEEGKKSLWNEDSGIASYELIVIQGGSTAIYRLEQDYNNYDANNRAHSFIKDGVSVYDANGNLTIYLFGNFVGNAGVIIRNENGWESAVPQKAITTNAFMVTIDVSQISYFEKYGDVKLSVVDGTNFSDDLTVRIKPFNVGNFADQQELLKFMLNRYGGK